VVFRIFPQKVSLSWSVPDITADGLPECNIDNVRCLDSPHDVPFSHRLRDLQTWIDSTASPDSIFHDSYAKDSTDTTVYPDPSHSSESKKRKLDDGIADTPAQLSSVTHARLPSQMLANQHLVKVHEAIKTECEDLVQLIVKPFLPEYGI
jgi:hypothetical protein